MKEYITLLISIFLFQVASSQTFHASDFDSYQTYLTSQTKAQSMLSNKQKKLLADFKSMFKTDYKLYDSLFPSVDSFLDSTTKNQEKHDTLFYTTTTGQVNFIGNLKRNDSIIFRVFNISEETISTTIDSTVKKTRKRYANYILDTKGQIRGKIQDFGNHTFQYIKDNKLLIFSNKHVPGKTFLIDPFSKDLRTFLKSETSNLYIFAEVIYFKGQDKENIHTE